MEPQSMQNQAQQNPIEHYIQLAQLLLTDLIESEGEECTSIFNSQEMPNISIGDFIKRVHRYTQFSKESLIIAIILLDRYNMANSEFTINELNVHKIFLACLLLSTKFQDDFYYDNKAFELAGGVNVAQLMLYQLEIFQKIEYQTFVSQQEYLALLQKLQNVYFGEETEEGQETNNEVQQNTQLTLK